MYYQLVINLVKLKNTGLWLYDKYANQGLDMQGVFFRGIN